MSKERNVTIKMNLKKELLFSWRLRKLRKKVSRVNSQLENCQKQIEKASLAMTKLAETELQVSIH